MMQLHSIQIPANASTAEDSTEVERTSHQSQGWKQLSGETRRKEAETDAGRKAVFLNKVGTNLLPSKGLDAN